MKFLDQISHALGTAVDNLSRVDDAMDTISKHVEKGLDVAEEVLFSLQEQVEKVRAQQSDKPDVWGDVYGKFFNLKAEDTAKAKEDYTREEKLDFIIPFLKEKSGADQWDEVAPGGSLRRYYLLHMGDFIDESFNICWAKR